MAVKSKLYSMTPKEIVAELDKYIIGQEDAKKSVAIALRNRYRRSLLSEEMREEITPKNILMMGPTGCGKTEIARRLAKLMDAPFVKVEATKFTEVGYVGRDVDSMVRDLVEASMRVTKQSKLEEKYSIAEEIAEEKIVEAIIPGKNKKKTGQGKNPFDFIMNSGGYPSQKQQYLDSQSSKDGTAPEENSVEMAREQVRQQLRQGLLEEQYIEIEVTDVPKGNQLDMSNEGMSIAIGNIFGDLIPPKTKKKNCKVKDARKILREQEAQKLIDVTRQSFFEGLKQATFGHRVSDISHAVQTYVESNGFSVVRDFVGHGVGTHLHEEPEVPNYGAPGHGPRLLPGMTIAIEPMVNVGTYNVRVLKDGWTTVTADGKLAAHYENTVLITGGEPEILTVTEGS